MTEVESTVSQPFGIDFDYRFENNKRVLVVDDDQDTVDLIKHILILANFDVASTSNSRETIDLLSQIKPDAVLLDLMMPEMNGQAILNQIRNVSDVPVLVVSAITGKDSIVEMLNNGSDDYITKPFDRYEMVARINAQIRRARATPFFDGVSIPEIDLVFNFSKHTIQFKNVCMNFSPKEFEIMQILGKKIPHVVTYPQIARELWGNTGNHYKNRIKYLIHSIRKKFAEVDPLTEVIVTVDRSGYRIHTD